MLLWEFFIKHNAILTKKDKFNMNIQKLSTKWFMQLYISVFSTQKHHFNLWNTVLGMN